MNGQTYSTIRKIMILIIGVVVVVSIILQNLIIAFAMIIFGMAIIVGLKHRLNIKIEDERIYTITQKASMRTVQIFGFLMALISITMLILKETFENFELIGSVLAYSACGFLLIYGLFFGYYSKKLG